MAYANDFKLMMLISLAAFPLLLAIKGAKCLLPVALPKHM